MTKRILKIFLWVVGIVATIIAVVLIYVMARWDAKVDRPAPDLTALKDSATVARGEYIFKYHGRCWSCHSAGSADANSPPSGGTIFDLRDVGPGFGIWYTRNLTMHIETGIGGWSDGEIVQAIREGVRKDRTTLFPLMPVDWYNGMSDEDALAVVAYLRSLPPVSHPVPPHQPSLIAKALFAFGILKPKPPVTKPVMAPPPGPTAAYGKYLTHNLSGCMECHTPRNLENGEFYLDSLGAGGSIDEGNPISATAGNITPDEETGIGTWSEEQFMTAITAGVRPAGTVIVPVMPYAYIKSLTEADLKAMYLYLQTLPPIPRRGKLPSYSPELISSHGIERGKLLFEGRCRSCHGGSGKGAQPTKVVLAEVAPSLGDDDLKEFIRAGNPGLKMPTFAKTLSEDELHDLVLFIRSWGDK